MSHKGNLAYVRAIRRNQLTENFREWGDLYGSDYLEVEAIEMREECEQVGVPMGYGRVGKTLSVLAEEYWPAAANDNYELRLQNRRQGRR